MIAFGCEQGRRVTAVTACLDISRDSDVVQYRRTVDQEFLGLFCFGSQVVGLACNECIVDLGLSSGTQADASFAFVVVGAYQCQVGQCRALEL